MELREAIRTTGAVRVFTGEHVDDVTVHGILDEARFAPSGGNRQGWRGAVVKDRSIRHQLGALMQPVWNEYTAQGATGATPFNVVEEVEVPDPAPFTRN